jgi:hypothetical protein
VLRDASLALSGEEVPHLVEARRFQRARWLWLGATFLAAGVGSVFLLLVTLGVLVFDPETATALGLLLLSSFPFVGAFWAHRQSRGARRQAEHAHHQAQLSAARDVLTGSARALTAHRVAHSLDLPLAATERLLAELNTDEAIESEVTEAGDITYRLAPLRARIALDDDSATSPDDAHGLADELDALPEPPARVRRSGAEPGQS